ncbi:MAG: PaaI family thioesterase [Acidimicrobiales bacterium]
MTTTDAGPPSRPPMVDDHFIGQLAIRTVPSDDADLVMELDCTPQRVNSRGGLQGGLVATLIDVVAGLVALRDLPDGVIPTTTNLAVTYLAGIRTGPARAEARVARKGKRSVVLQVEVHDVGSGRLAAIGTVSFMLVPIGPTTT